MDEVNVKRVIKEFLNGVHKLNLELVFNLLSSV